MSQSGSSATRIHGLESALPQSTNTPGLTIADLYRDNFQYVWRCLRRLGVHQSSVDDAAQDVFLVAPRKLDSFEGRSSHKVWLFAIALRVAKEHRRRDTRLELDPDALGVATHPDTTLDLRQRANLLDRILDCLNDEQREVFVMAEIEQWSAPEIAAALSLKLNTVYSRLRLARAQFERALARHHAALEAK